MVEHVRFSVDAGVATLTMNRADNRNALSAELVNDLGDGLSRAMGDSGVRVIVLTNTGPAFCAGADLEGGGDADPRYSLPDLLSAIMDGPKPVLGRIDGHCTGGGVGLAAACDISLMRDDAVMGFTEVRIGVAPAVISVVCLPKMRRSDAAELFLSGQKVSAGRAAAVGLVNHAVPADQLDARVDDITAQLLRGGPEALALSKSLISRVPDMDRADAFEWTQARSAARFASAEAAEGIAAFLQKRDPAWIQG